MRASKDQKYQDFLMRVGDGSEKEVKPHTIKIPFDMAISSSSEVNSIQKLINYTFPEIQHKFSKKDYFVERAILSPKNTHVNSINNLIQNMLAGEEITYKSFDSVEDDPKNLYQVEFLNQITVSGYPPHQLKLKIGCPIILLRNIDKQLGLCNGTRLVCKNLGINLIEAEIFIGERKGQVVVIPRIPLITDPQATGLPFKMKRK